MEPFPDKRTLWLEPQGCLGQEWWNYRKMASGEHVRSMRRSKTMGVTTVCPTRLQQNPNSFPRSREQSAGIFISCFDCWLLRDLPLRRCRVALVVMETGSAERGDRTRCISLSGPADALSFLSAVCMFARKEVPTGGAALERGGNSGRGKMPGAWAKGRRSVGPHLTRASPWRGWPPQWKSVPAPRRVPSSAARAGCWGQGTQSLWGPSQRLLLKELLPLVPDVAGRP